MPGIPMPGIGFVGQNLYLAYFMLIKTYTWHMLCWIKPIPSIGYVRQNLFLVGQNHIWDLVVKICKTRCFPSKNKFPKLNNGVFFGVIIKRSLH